MGSVGIIYDELFRSECEVCCYVILTHYGTYYTGITNSLIRRWSEHVSGQSSYLSVYRAKEVVYVELFENRRLARKREVQIKRIGAKIFLLRLKHRKQL